MNLFRRLGRNVGRFTTRNLGAAVSGFAAGGPFGAAAAVGANSLLGRTSLFGGTAAGTVGIPFDPINGPVMPDFPNLPNVPPGPSNPPMMPSHGGLGGPSLTLYQGGRATRGMRFTRQSAIEYFNATGHVPPGYHQTGPRSLYSVARNRRMNPLNPRALRRAMHRAKSFARFASHVVSFVKHGAHGAKFKYGRKGKRR